MTPVTELHEPETQSSETPFTEIQKQPRHAAGDRLALSPLAPQPLFADVLLEVDGTERRRRKWAAASSVVFQSLLLGTVLILPLMFTEALPRAELLTMLVAPPPPPPPPAGAAPLKVIKQIQSNLVDGGLRAPSRIPQKVEMIKEDEAPPQMASGIGVVGGVPGGQIGGVIGGIISSTTHIAVVPKLAPPAPPKILRISEGVTEGQKIYAPEPKYPRIAQEARVQGVVVLTAIISKTGEIQDLQVVSGHPMLIAPAIEAVKQWRFRPFLLDREPVEVETTVRVTFHISS